MSKRTQKINKPRTAEDLQALAAIRREELHLAHLVEGERNRPSQLSKYPRYYALSSSGFAPMVPLRDAVLARDHGLCAICNLDTNYLSAALLYVWKKCEWQEWRLQFGLFRKAIGEAAARYPHRMWEADHRIPVSLGGSNDLSNVRTLCLKCHGIETRRLRDKTREYQPTPDRTPDQPGSGTNR